MKKKNLQSLKLNKMTISLATIIDLKGGGVTAGSDCVSECLGHECQVHK
ncbi:hypothetical protein IMCC3317_00910 [Kordia antarctica]|uniref:Uncharacterized protein n=1 Tax=Kordia antarctica TaxID=1218801 RepID=A0A7L4ZDM4_9FLAO|nr:hypothetical protein [Kordia antarctica]QHI34747.1 hypothetical protein IMCC3317_00910 [Kordia antarctica]